MPFDPELYFASGAVDIESANEDHLGEIGATAPVLLNEKPGEEQWVLALPVQMELPNNAAFKLPYVQLFECDMGCTSAYALLLPPADALRLAQALIGAATQAICGEFTKPVQQLLNERADQ